MNKTYLFACNKKTVPNIEKKHVIFNLVPNVIYDSDDLTKELNEYRKSNIFQKKADALRMEKMLSPILSVEHRLKIWNKIYG